MVKPVVEKLILFLFVISGLTACGGGGGGSDKNSVPEPTSQNVSGGGVKGPLANAIVTVFVFDASQTGFKGAVAATGTTDNSAAITGLALPFPISPPYIMEFTSDAGTTDITTGVAPVITTLRTVITQSLLDSGEQIYATPLTTMAVDIAVANAADINGTAGIQADEFETALAVAASQVVSTLGFGLDSTVDIFDTPPLVDSTTDSAAEQTAVAAYRAAVEAVTAVAFQISQQNVGGNTDSVLAELAADLADGGGIDGSAGTQINTNTLQVLEQDPATLPIPNSPTNQTVADVQAILVAEAATTAPATPVTELDAGGSITTTPAPAETDPDTDGDGTLNVDDTFPDDASETTDSDGDGIGDVADTDDDNNGVLDEDEGVTPVVTPTDSDGDGVVDVSDNCPLNVNQNQTNTDGDAEGDACDADDDGDGTDDILDAFPLDNTETVDTDSDGTGNTADTDDDNDGVLDGADTGVSPLDGTTACAVLIDCDGDGVFDGADFDPVDATITFNFAPIALDDAIVATEDDPTFAIDVTANDTDDDGNPGDTVTLTVIGANDTSIGTAIINGNNIDYTPAADASGIDTFSYTVSDGTETSSATVTVTITAANDAPEISQASPVAVSMDEDGVPIAFVGPSIDATDAEGDTLNWSGAAASNGTATVSGAGVSPTISYVPNANFFGVDSFDVTVSDGNGGSDTVTIDVTVTTQNDNPVIAQTGPLAVGMDEDGVSTAFVAPVITATDVDSGTLNWSGTVAANGTATVSGTGASPTITYVPNADFNGIDSFDVIVSDGSGNDTITIDVTINPQNDDPVIAQTGPLAVGMDEDGTPMAFNAPTITATDIDLDTLTWSGTAATDGTATVSGTGASPTITYVPNADFNGSDSFDVTASDGNGGSDTITVDVTIATQNDLPTIGGTPITVATDGIAYSFTPTADDIDGETLSFSIQNQPSWATSFNTSDGTLSGTPGPGDVAGSFINIIISVTASVDTVDLPAFSITVNATAPGGAVWDSFNWGDGSTWQ